MDKIIYFVKIISITQVILIIACIVVLYITKITFVFQENKKIKRETKAKKLLLSLANDEKSLTKKTIKLFRKTIFFILTFLREHADQSNVDTIVDKISNKLLIPAAKKLYWQKNWYKRYIATLCYMYVFEPTDEKKLLKLIHDDVLLVAINAATVGVRFHNEKLINGMINVFSVRRRVQQAVCAEIIMREKPPIYNIIAKRISAESDVYIKEFCYRLLIRLPDKNKVYPEVTADLKIENTELRISILRYIGQLQDDCRILILKKFVQDPKWEVRAVVAKMLGYYVSDESVLLLEKMLTDSQSWVRVNAAQALLLQGNAGLAVLQSQSTQIDKFAYESAQVALKQAGVISDNN